MDSARGFKAAREYSLWEAIFGRRSRRVAAGASFRSGTFSFQSALEPQPLSRLEEAFLIAATGITGLAFADNPYEAPPTSVMGVPRVGVRSLRRGVFPSVPGRSRAFPCAPERSPTFPCDPARSRALPAFHAD
jgi:hypothetical protein